MSEENIFMTWIYKILRIEVGNSKSIYLNLILHLTSHHITTSLLQFLKIFLTKFFLPLPSKSLVPNKQTLKKDLNEDSMNCKSLSSIWYALKKCRWFCYQQCAIVIRLMEFCWCDPSYIYLPLSTPLEKVSCCFLSCGTQNRESPLVEKDSALTSPSCLSLLLLVK